MKHDEHERRKQEQMMKKSERKQCNMIKKSKKKQWKIMNKKEKTMKNDEQERKNNKK